MHNVILNLGELATKEVQLCSIANQKRNEA